MYPIFVFTNIFVGILLSLMMGWVAIRIARRIGLMDVPGALPHKKHSVAMPYAGGLTLVLTLLICGFLFNFSMIKDLWNIFIPVLLVFTIGLWDDFKRLPARIKLIGQVTAAVLLIALGTSVSIIPSDFLGLPGQANDYINWLITLFWVVGVTNAFNFIDSMDGSGGGCQRHCHCFSDFGYLRFNSNQFAAAADFNDWYLCWFVFLQHDACPLFSWRFRCTNAWVSARSHRHFVHASAFSAGILLVSAHFDSGRRDLRYVFSSVLAHTARSPNLPGRTRSYLPQARRAWSGLKPCSGSNAYLCDCFRLPRLYCPKSGANLFEYPVWSDTCRWIGGLSLFGQKKWLKTFLHAIPLNMLCTSGG